ncbi:NAD(P)-binding protein [Wolfiporia cocos MD-104 SS10]|uniref:NAD(P)-binding protein n=1 Tax=Wolfiporia cocos (strain MD-104) TaxID=742152 RepID=A0A2H3JDL5_WOLCO|nr:NAD(P)-binding protein [Wolfiporia cocos MD-104 SS10]
MGREARYFGLVMSRAICPGGTFKDDQIPDLSGKVMIVTGGNTGIGKATVKVLLQHNAKVYMGARSKGKADEAIQQLKEETGKEAIWLQMDLSNLASVRKAAEDFLSKETELHVLFNNAGVMVPPVEQVTADGYDLQFGTNVVGPFLFTKLLIPALLAAKETSPDSHARIIITSSSAAMLANLKFDTFRDGPERKKTSTSGLYAQSKLANAVMAQELSRRYGAQGILSLSVDPGAVRTDLQRHVKETQGSIADAIIKPMLRPPSFGALSQLWAGTMPEVLKHNGAYVVPTAKVAECRAEAYDPEIGRKLWEWLESEVEGR